MNILNLKNTKETKNKTSNNFGINSKINNILHPEIVTNITLKEAQIIANWIIQENKIHKHMIEKSPSQIMQEINSGLGVVAKIGDELVGAMSMIKMKLKNGEEIFEAGSLITNPEKRGMGIAKVLSKEIFIQNFEKAVYSITEVPGVMHIYKDILKLSEFNKFSLDKEILEKIEEVGALLPTDKIYGNKKFLQLNK